MAILPIYNCFHEVMKKPTEEIKEFNQEIKDLVDNMFETLYNISNGVGLAGNQVGESKSLLIIDTTVGTDNPRTNPIHMINPVIVAKSDETLVDQEGCLSIPTYFEKVERAKSVQVKYYDVNMKEHNLEATDFFARVIQHETDHLTGKCIYDRITPIRRTLAKNKLKKIERGSILGDYQMVMANGKLIDP